MAKALKVTKAVKTVAAAKAAKAVKAAAAAKAVNLKKPPKSFFWWIGVSPYLARKWGKRSALTVIATTFLMICLYAFVNPPTTIYMLQESSRLKVLHHEWRDFDEISPHMAAAIVAAEDANFCSHWGFDLAAIRSALEGGSGRGASTVTQQTVKNVYLWHGRSYVRKAMEAMITPLMEVLWSKKRIVEVYMNVAEFDEGVFGVGAAAEWYFGVDAKDLSFAQAARLAAVLPSPKTRSAVNPTPYLRKRARSIESGIETIRFDGRSACFDG